MRVCFYFPQPDPIARYRVYHPFLAARAAGVDAHMVAELDRDILEAYDAFYYAGPLSIDSLLFAEWVRRSGKLLVYDVPSGYLSEWWESPHDPWLAQSLECVRAFMREADVLVAPNAFLAGQARELGEHVFEVPSFIDPRVWSDRHPKSREELGLPADSVTLGWAGDERSAEELVDAQRFVAEAMGSNPMARLITIGYEPTLTSVPDLKRLHVPVDSFAQYVSALHHVDVVVIPSSRSLSNRCMCVRRALEHGMAGSAVVALETVPFVDMVAAGAPLSIAADGPSLSETLGGLLGDADAREAARGGMAGHVRAKWLLDDNLSAFAPVFDKLTESFSQGGGT